MTKPIFALSIQQPWAWAILFAGKDIENRTWWPHQRFLNQNIYIHAGKRIDREGFDDIESICGRRPPLDLPTGALVGVVRLHSAVSFEKTTSRWACGPVCFVLGNPRPFDWPVPCRGQLGFFKPKIPMTI